MDVVDGRIGTAMSDIVKPQASELEAVRFTESQRKILLDIYANGASESDFRALVAVAESRGLNPLNGDCHFVKRWDREKNGWKWSVQPSIDSFRARAERSGLYAGQDEPEYEYDAKGRLTLARVRVWRKDWQRPSVGVAHWDEYVQTTKDGHPTSMWANKPRIMLAKCAEAIALRKGFPLQNGALFTADEMGGNDDHSPPPRLAQQTTARDEEYPDPVADREAAALPPRPASEPPPPAEDHRTPEHRERKAAEELLFARLRDAMMSAPDLEALAKLRDELRGAKLKLSMDHWADLGALGKARKEALEAEAKAQAEADAKAYAEQQLQDMGPLPAAWGGSGQDVDPADPPPPPDVPLPSFDAPAMSNFASMHMGKIRDANTFEAYRRAQSRFVGAADALTKAEQDAIWAVCEAREKEFAADRTPPVAP